MTKRELCKRYFVFLIGLFISSFGVSFVTKAALGTSPISSIPYVLSLDLPWTLGEFTIVFSVLLIILQIVILGRNFQKVSLLQIPVSILFGYFIDLSMLLLVWLNPQQWVSKFLALFIGCVILAFGVYIEVIANVVMLPGEAFVKAVTVRFHTDFGTTKVCFDASMTVIAGVLSLVLFHALQGVGIGTIIAALIVGFIAKFFGRILMPFTELLFGKVEEKIITDEPEETPLVITIAREYGSGGRDIGKALAKRLSIEYYDTKVLKIAARESGKTQAYIDKNDQKVTGSLIFDLYLESTAYTAGVAENGKSAFGAEEQVIKELAAKKSCVIVGRLANFTLQNHKNAFHIFVHGDMKDKVRRVMERDGLSRTEAEKKIKTMDRERGEHCRLVTGKEWGQARYYDLSVNTSKYNTEQIVDFILNFCK
ncbi:MAG: cytidylate kinase family protein [Lachnospiraceae bacterium]|nr:cytidylate kinase family protein [Lachnospiraceae bacterium]MDD3617711.1 cytidylate kinase family protein [Lachnospiraceae bacterium]